MSAETPTIHVLNKSDYSKHFLVKLNNETRPPLAPSSLRFRPRILGQTTNNLTYARLGHLMGWYDTYPLPANTSAPYNDNKTYGRISAWGYAEIVDSTVHGIHPGETLYGYFPISTGLEDIEVEFAAVQPRNKNSNLTVLSPHRQHLWKIYNALHLHPALPTLQCIRGLDALALDALMQPLFGTAYNLNTHVFAWVPENRVHPSGAGPWTNDDADITGATVVVLNASGKTGMSFAWALRNARPGACQPDCIVGVGSEASVDAIRGCGFYDSVVANEGFGGVVDRVQGGKVVLVNFGAREGVMEVWVEALGEKAGTLTRVSVGGDVKVQREVVGVGERTNQVNASALREKGIQVGGAGYFEAFEEAWGRFVEAGGIPGMRIEWGKGVEGWEKGWECFCRDEVRPDRGLVYRL